MTYNFDPDKWYEIEQDALDRRLAAGELNADAHAAASDALYSRYCSMLDRIDGSYRLVD